jgi:DNA-directed RNA polymerase specialized sigma24 family protein
VETAAASDPHRHLEERERERALMECLETLEARRRLAVRAHLSGFTVAEIMEMFDWSYQRARHLIARGMADLRRALRERGIHE